MIMVHGHVLDVQYVYLQISSGRCFSVFFSVLAHQFRGSLWRTTRLALTTTGYGNYPLVNKIAIEIVNLPITYT